MFKTNIYSLLVCALLSVALLAGRVLEGNGSNKNASLSLMTWDAFGYYIYLPSALHRDFRQLQWLPAAEAQYHLTGGNLYQANKCATGNYVFKYLGGVAILEAPFFAFAHLFAQAMHYPPDGFSPPYQWAMAMALWFYTVLALWGLRRFLRYYFEDTTTALTLFVTFAATNLPQYTAFDAAQSHAFILPLYVGVLFASRSWHLRPTVFAAVAVGYLVGFATICRPTELVMLFIPLLWATHSPEAAKQKWALVAHHKTHIAYACLAAFLGVLPQMLYWKLTAGAWAIDVGSKWLFLNPNWRVLFGGEKGWFIYTPATIFMILGLFFTKKHTFHRSVLVFSLLNIWIIIAWFDWTYGASYSCRALVQHLPVFALPLAAFSAFLQTKKWFFSGFIALSIYLFAVNLFQMWQYKQTILHYRDNNFAYYRAIYLNPHPSALDMSLLDAPKVVFDKNNYKTDIFLQKNTKNIDETIDSTLYSTLLYENTDVNTEIYGIKATLNTKNAFWNSKICAAFLNEKGDTLAQNRFRINHALTKENSPCAYAFYTQKPASEQGKKSRFVVFIYTPDKQYKGEMQSFEAINFSKK